ncbi:hypothetical protein AVEN_15416-1 [Araneus ventricosus]|uniref:Uncharacterized protein n=1 Tax=Araneus ventricosus TaxID=182803 RepID=A0A4Y2CSQ6_ARAVE|nr:hypothetical protein AVEN_15416-1 [Araneus ventricosus]
MTVAKTAVGNEVGAQTAITGHGLTPPEGGTSNLRSGGNTTPHHYCTPRRSENPLTYTAASHPRTHGDREAVKSKVIPKSLEISVDHRHCINDDRKDGGIV